MLSEHPLFLGGNIYIYITVYNIILNVMKLYTHKKWFSAKRDNRVKILSIKRPTVTRQIEHFTNNVKGDDEKVIKRADFCSDVPVGTRTR